MTDEKIVAMIKNYSDKAINVVKNYFGEFNLKDQTQRMLYLKFLHTISEAGSPKHVMDTALSAFNKVVGHFPYFDRQSLPIHERIILLRFYDMAEIGIKYIATERR